jgi:mono/diheme cytochrome c family protein
MKATFKVPFIHIIILTGLCSLYLYSCNNNTAQTDDPPTRDQMLEQGKYLVESMGCNDCHTPTIMTPNGPVDDSSRFLSGIRQTDTSLQPFDASEISLIKSGGAIILPTGAWTGGWGVSFPANLTPDSTTGIGGWNADIFIRTIRSGKYQGVSAGRPLMPPMPWKVYSKLTDNDLKAIFAYLQTIPAVHNQVPSYIPFNQIPIEK